MTKESKILLATVIICALLLAGLELFLHRQALVVNIKVAQEINKSVKATPVATPAVLEAASPSANAKGKATETPKATVKASPTPDASVEEKPAE